MATKKKAAPETETVTPEPDKPVVTKHLQVRLDGKVVFSQDVDASTIDLGFRGGNVSVSASTVGADPVADQPIMVPVDQINDILGSEPPVHDEDEGHHPGVNMRIHSGRRPAAADQEPVDTQTTQADVADHLADDEPESTDEED